MSLSDPVADMLTRIRNAQQAGLQTVAIPYSRLKSEIARILKAEGYIQDCTTENRDGERTMIVYLRFTAERRPVITGIKRVSRPGLRCYVNHEEIPRVLRGMGISILSTSSGIMTDNQARKQGIGGEVMCQVW